MDIYDTLLTKQAEKDLSKLPKYVVIKLLAWIEDVEARGLSNVRKVTGYHDEPLKGKRQGQRSIRLSKAYRAIYVIDVNGKVKFVKVVEVNKHDY